MNENFRQKWLEQGFILQGPDGQYRLGQGPFSYSEKHSPDSLYHPDFFLRGKRPWLKPARLWKTDRKRLEKFLFEPLIKLDSAKRASLPIRRGMFSSTLKKQTSLRMDEKSAVALQDILSTKVSFITYQEMFFQARRAFKTGFLQKAVPVFYEEFDLPLALAKKRTVGSALPFDVPKGLVQSEKSRQKTVSPFCEEYDFRLNRLFLLQNIFKKSGSILNGFLYGIWNQHSGLLGLTPEFLFSIRGENFATMALAGTAPHPGPSLLKDKKEQREQDLVARNIRESLQGFVRWKKHEVYEMPFEHLKHLRSDLSGRLNQKFNFEDICGKLHPTPALGGYPARRAFEWLKHCSSQVEKRLFGAPFGFFASSREAFCLVALRALEWSGREGGFFPERDCSKKVASKRNGESFP